MRRASAPLPPHYHGRAQCGSTSSNGARGRRSPSAPSRAEQLFREIELYLAAVARYRQLECEPTWRNERLEG